MGVTQTAVRPSLPLSLSPSLHLSLSPSPPLFLSQSLSLFLRTRNLEQEIRGEKTGNENRNTRWQLLLVGEWGILGEMDVSQTALLHPNLRVKPEI